ncbi:acyl-CoA dehydrogenase family protein [Lysobacter sp. SG-8]|uniref:Acyl-CoA dehydrogenase family protein n=1 Tax=Marilutibacter penaei TaxID=2759900 RepID=A0A7W3U1R1_9GAMM|nr:acyl-CoA dehydrogenase [Lysobacter penaei]MBB1087010.1 acyl-CoA dehydrogenase family protein [Lysobacter penaei]
MDFSFSEEQQMLQDMTERFVAGRYGFEARERIRASAAGWSPDLWRELGELGLLALAVPEADGGIDAGPVGTMLVARAMGAGLLLEPFIASAVVATTAVARCPAGEGRDALLAAMLAGEQLVVPLDEVLPTPGTIAATQEDTGWRLRGRKPVVYHAPIADVLLVAAHHDGRTALFAVPRTATGVEIESFRTLDDAVAGRVTLDLVVGMDACLSTDAGEALGEAFDRGLAAFCADALGSMERALQATLEYARSRVQFGVPIGRFQALQHRLADMLVQLEQARSMTYLATSSLDEADITDRRAALSGAKALVGQAARAIAQESVQLHGGMGMTDELDVSHHFRRLTAFELRHGSTDAHLRAWREHSLGT